MKITWGLIISVFIGLSFCLSIFVAIRESIGEPVGIPNYYELNIEGVEVTISNYSSKQKFIIEDSTFIKSFLFLIRDCKDTVTQKIWSDEIIDLSFYGEKKIDMKLYVTTDNRTILNDQTGSILISDTYQCNDSLAILMSEVKRGKYKMKTSQ